MVLLTFFVKDLCGPAAEVCDEVVALEQSLDEVLDELAAMARRHLRAGG